MNLDLLKALIRSKKRVFTLQDAKELAQGVGMKQGVLRAHLYRLKKKGLIDSLAPGLYKIGSEFMAGIPIHEYEIGLALTSPSAIAFLSAMHYHKLTDQTSRIIYVLGVLNATKKASSSSYRIDGVRYRIVRTNKENFFGIERVNIGEARVVITDLERTLIDGIIRPKFCGGIREVLHAYSVAFDRINIDKIISYAQKISDATCKRLGYILSRLGVEQDLLKPLKKRSSKSFAKLDPSGPNSGPWNKEWYIRENL